MKIFKNALPYKVKEALVSKVGNYQAEKLTETLLNGTLAQKEGIIKDFNLEDCLMTNNCGNIIMVSKLP